MSTRIKSTNSFFSLIEKIAVVCIFFSFISCVTTPTTVTKQFPYKDDSTVMIMGQGSCDAIALYDFFKANQPNGNLKKAQRLAHYYVDEAKKEGVNSDVAFIQMCLETGFLKFGGLVEESFNNFCGLGAIDSAQRGCKFSSELQGVKAHIQHLKAYGSSRPLNENCVDPRYKYVNPKGKAPTVDKLAGTWAADKKYGQKLLALLKKLKT